MSYSIEIAKELSVGDEVFWVAIEADVWFRNDEEPEPYIVEITKAQVAPLEGDDLPLDYEGKRIEKLIVVGHPALTEAIDVELWERIQQFAEDNDREIMFAIRDSRDDWNL